MDKNDFYDALHAHLELEGKSEAKQVAFLIISLTDGGMAITRGGRMHALVGAMEQVKHDMFVKNVAQGKSDE